MVVLPNQVHHLADRQPDDTSNRPSRQLGTSGIYIVNHTIQIRSDYVLIEALQRGGESLAETRQCGHCGSLALHIALGLARFKEEINRQRRECAVDDHHHELRTERRQHGYVCAGNPQSQREQNTDAYHKDSRRVTPDGRRPRHFNRTGPVTLDSPFQKSSHDSSSVLPYPRSTVRHTGS